MFAYVAPRVSKVGFVFPLVRASIEEKLLTKSAQDCSASSICSSKCQKSEGIGAPLEDRVGKSARRDCNCIDSSVRTSQWYKNYKMHQEVTEKYPFQISPRV